MSRLVRAFLVALACILPGVAALAQTPEASPVASGIEGLVESASRQYSTDPELVPADDPEALVVITAHLFRFDNDGHAREAYEAVTENPSEALLGGGESGEEGPEIEEAEIDDLGDRAYAIWLSATHAEDGVTGHFRALYVQDGEFLLLVTAIAGTEDATAYADDIARVMTERDAGDGEAATSDDGTSTGGIWDKFPPAGDEAVEGLIPFRDTFTPTAP